MTDSSDSYDNKGDIPLTYNDDRFSDGSAIPWRLEKSDGLDDWYCLLDANGRYVSDACVEGYSYHWREAVQALRSRANFEVKRLGIEFSDSPHNNSNNKQVGFYSPRNTQGLYAYLPIDLVDALADHIEQELARHAL